MFVRKVGAVYPVWAAEGEGAGGAGAGAAGAGDQGGKPNANGNGGEGGQNGSAAFDPDKTFEGLEADNLEWLQKNAPLRTDPKALAKHAFNQEKLLGNAVRVPGKDATPEERDAFLNKLGRPAKADDYAYTTPKDMPKDMPYDGEKAKAFKTLSHQLGLTQDQSAKLHDWFIADQVGGFNGMTEARAKDMQTKGEAATADLVKLWGPLDGEMFRKNVEIADKVFTQVPGGPEVLAELKSLGLVGPNKEILSTSLAKMFASLGTALYTEDGVLHGDPAAVGNPFADGDNFNLTQQMHLVRTNPEAAKSLILAAGKKVEDFFKKT